MFRLISTLALSLSCMPLLHADYITEVLSDNPIAYYRFEETSGAVAADTSTAGANHDAAHVNTTLGMPSYGQLGKAADFAGSAAVRITDHVDFDLGTGDFAVELWYQTSITTRGDLLTYKGTGGDFGIHSNSQGADIVSAYHGGFLNTAAGSAANTWHHYVISRDAGTSSFYLDGNLLGSAAHANTLDITNDLLIGSNHGGNPATLAIGFTGQIDEVAFYASPLGATRVSAHFAAAIPEPSTMGLLGLGLLLLARRSRRARR